MTSSSFDAAFGEHVAPVLERFGFREVGAPPGWIVPSKLYLRGKTWFAAESDRRDGYLACTLGRLFRFRDVLPRAIVRGPYRYEVSGQYQDAVVLHLRRVAAELPEALAHMEENWPRTPELEQARWGRSESGEAGYERYLAALGSELTDWPLGTNPASQPVPPNER